ncbi:hypothetical protein K3495_g14573, partial [Podosphaera aphanis]
MADYGYDNLPADTDYGKDFESPHLYRGSRGHNRSKEMRFPSPHSANSQTPYSFDNMPVFKICSFSGVNQDAARWVFNLKRAFRAAGIVGEIPPDMWIGAIWGGVEGKAIQWMDGVPHIKKIVDTLRTTPHLITKKIADRFTEEFEAKFKMVEEPEVLRSPREILNELCQEPKETLTEYYTKARGVLQLLGVHSSNSQVPDVTTLTSVVTEMTVSQFVSGLHDDQLRSRVTERGAASENNLEGCFKVIRDCWRSMIDEKRQNLLQQESWKSRGFERIMASPNHMDQVLKEYVSQGYGTQRTNRYRSPFGNPSQANSMHRPYNHDNPIQEPKPHQLLPSKSLPAPLAVSLNNQILPNNQNHIKPEPRYQGPEYRGENPWRGESSWRPRDFYGGGDYAGASIRVNQSTSARDTQNTPPQDPLSSRHPMVNGTVAYRNVCWKCGNGPNMDAQRHEAGHCYHPLLQPWESEVLRRK